MGITRVELVPIDLESIILPLYYTPGPSGENRTHSSRSTVCCTTFIQPRVTMPTRFELVIPFDILALKASGFDLSPTASYDVSRI